MCITALSSQEVADRNHPRWRERLASVGRAQLAMQVTITDPESRPLANGTIGEIMVVCDAVMRRYWQNSRATARSLVAGWLRTGGIWGNSMMRAI